MASKTITTLQIGIESFHDRKHTLYNSILIAIGTLVGITLLGYIVTAVKMVHDMVVSPKRRVKKIGSR